MKNRKEGYWAANLELRSLWGSRLAEMTVQPRLMGAERAGWMAVPRHLVIRMASMLALQYQLESNLVGSKACQRRKDERKAVTRGYLRVLVPLMAEKMAQLIR